MCGCCRVQVGGGPREQAAASQSSNIAIHAMQCTIKGEFKLTQCSLNWNLHRNCARSVTFHCHRQCRPSIGIFVLSFAHHSSHCCLSLLVPFQAVTLSMANCHSFCSSLHCGYLMWLSLFFIFSLLAVSAQ